MSEPSHTRPGLAAASARWGALAALSAFVAVMAGAFGAHALSSRLPADALAIWETAARYQMVHALALLAVAWALDRAPRAALTVAAWLFSIGTVIFSGSLYALAWSGARWLGAVTPLGGLCLLGGWLSLAAGLRRGRSA